MSSGRRLRVLIARETVSVDYSVPLGTEGTDVCAVLSDPLDVCGYVHVCEVSPCLGAESPEVSRETLCPHVTRSHALRRQGKPSTSSRTIRSTSRIGPAVFHVKHTQFGSVSYCHAIAKDGDSTGRNVG